MAEIGALSGVKPVGQSPRQFLHPALRDAAERGDGNFLLDGIERHRLQRGLLAQRVHDGARKTSGGIRLASGLGNSWARHSHDVGTLPQRENVRDGKNLLSPLKLLNAAGKIRQASAKIRLVTRARFWQVLVVAGINFGRATKVV